MSFEISVGPSRLAINQGHSFLVTDTDGEIPFPTDKGLYFFDTRMISSWQIYANGKRWELLNSAAINYYSCRIFLTNGALITEDGTVEPKTLGLVVSRSLRGGMHEDIDVTNYGNKRVRFNLEIAIRSDFADLFEVKAARIVRRGRIKTDWDEPTSQLSATYSNKDFQRRLIVRAARSDSSLVYANGRLTLDIDLPAGGTWHTCLLYDLCRQGDVVAAPPACFEQSGTTEVAKRLEDWRQTVLKLRTSNEHFYRLYDQAVSDIASLRLPLHGGGHLEFVPAAGVPWFVALFGRDCLTASLQCALVYPDFARSALTVLGKLQATERDDYRDAEPGKIMHELRLGELAHFKLVPHTPYYGTADATPLYLIVLHSAWKCTGDAAVLHENLATAERCLAWIDEYGDRDHDGFQEYGTRSTAGYANQGWKDAEDAVMCLDGTPVKGPKALCELQGYVYDAWIRMAEVFDFLEQRERAEQLRAKARVLFERFNDAFWDEATGFYAYALDGDKNRILTVASNPGHCLWSGIVPIDRAERVVRRLMAPDMWSGWGIRTLSADHVSFNPHSYQNGSVWPHDNGIIAMGFKRYGFAAEAARIARDVSGAGNHFTLSQVPELYAGLLRLPSTFPVQYLGANVPQAWAAGSTFHFIQAILGIIPDAPHKRLSVDPVLPDWLRDVTLSDLRVGDSTFDIRFWRDGNESRWEVLHGPAELVHGPGADDRRASSHHVTTDLV